MNERPPLPFSSSPPPSVRPRGRPPVGGRGGDFVRRRTNLESAEIATYCADAENCGFYLWPLRARELFRADNETRALRSETRALHCQVRPPSMYPSKFHRTTIKAEQHYRNKTEASCRHQSLNRGDCYVRASGRWEDILMHDIFRSDGIRRTCTL